MRHFTISLLLFVSFQLCAQSRTKLSYGFSLNPTATIGVNTSNSKAVISTANGQTNAQYADSVKGFETYKLSIGAAAWVNYMINTKWTLQAGLGYSEVGFTRNQKSIQFNDKLYPGIGSGKLQELSNTEKNIQYSYKYQYISIPILFNYFLKRSGDYKWTYYLTAGAAANILVNHQLKAKLENFYVGDKNVFHLDSSGYDATRFALNVFVGARVEYKLDKGLGLFIQPMITAFPLSVSKTELKSYPVGLQVNCGIVYVFDQNKDEQH